MLKFVPPGDAFFFKVPQFLNFTNFYAQPLFLYIFLFYIYCVYILIVSREYHPYCTLRILTEHTNNLTFLVAGPGCIFQFTLLII